MDSAALSGHSACPAGYSAGSSSNSFQDRWESLKKIIEHQYINEKRKLPELAEYMKTNHNFDAGVHQYKYQFKKWCLRKNVPSAAKNQIGRRLHTRAEVGRPSTTIQYKGHDVAPEKIRRYLKDKSRQGSILKRPASSMGVVASAKLAFGKNIFIHWNMPYGAFKSSGSDLLPSSPYATAPSPYEDITMATPPSDAASPGSLTVQRKMNADALQRAATERAKLFMQGQHAELIKTMSTQDFRVMNEWLYQFWFFAFKSAKLWGYGPRYWTAAELQFEEFEAACTSNRGTLNSSPSAYGISPRIVMSPSANESCPWPEPSQLCKWVIHEHCKESDSSLDTSSESSCEQNPLDESTWHRWPSSWQEPPFQERIRDALEHNDFSTLKSEVLPIAIPRVSKAAERSPNEMLTESLSFAIMGRNWKLTQKLMAKANEENIDVSTCNPFHLAASYLDGSKTCCSVFYTLYKSVGDRVHHQDDGSGYTPRERLMLSTDELGHTVAEKLMLSVLRSHTRILPSTVDPTNHETRFPGDEVDICGRWDADSDCYRSLLSRGIPAAPPEWKHKFCHTAAQVVSDVLQFEWAFSEQPDDEWGGLFSRLCTACGLKLKMSHLHALVVTAFHLAESGFDNEDLFGILALTLRMLEMGANPFIESAVSIDLLGILQADSMDTCTHENLTPAELAQLIGYLKIHCWSEKLATGWNLLCWVLRRSENFWCPEPVNTFDLENDDDKACWDHTHSGRFRNDPVLATLWASVQTELLTYRRVNPGDPWISDNFDMERLLWGLEVEEKVSIGLVEKSLMKPHCRCGSFDAMYVCRHHVSAIDFSNMDVRDRAFYLWHKNNSFCS